MKFQIFTILIFVAMLLGNGKKDLTLPVYNLTVKQEYLNALYDEPDAEAYYPAEFSYGDSTYSCQVKFRGATSLWLPKKSWKIKFDDEDNIFEVEKLNLNAEYRDKSYMRNYLAMNIFRNMGYEASKTEHISLKINGQYKGVFAQVEQVDELFLKKRGIKTKSMYKAISNACSMAPIVKYDHYIDSWDKKIGNEDDYSNIQLLFNKLMYFNNTDFNEEIDNLINIDNALTHYAVLYTLCSDDSFKKNYYLYQNKIDKKFCILPWDNDASFGNAWNGEYIARWETTAEFYQLSRNVLFMKLMRDSDNREIFWNKVKEIVGPQFTKIHTLIDNTYDQIKNDVYSDEFKNCTNAEFDEEMEVLHGFLDARKAFLENHETYQNESAIEKVQVSTAFPNSENNEIIVRVKASQVENVKFRFIGDLDFSQYGALYNKEDIKLYDDGLHEDGEAGDLLYANRINLDNCVEDLIPFVIATENEIYPIQGLDYVQYYRFNSFLINKTDKNHDIENRLKVSNVYNISDDFFIELENISDNKLDLSYCYLNSGEYYNNFVIPEFTYLASGEKIVIASNLNTGAELFPNQEVIGNLFFDIAIDDTIKILSPTFNQITSKVVNNFLDYDFGDEFPVLNEICYNSNDTLNAGDWVEIYNPTEQDINMSGWIFKDSGNKFKISNDIILQAYSYLILCQDKENFSLVFPDAQNVAGDFDFGLSSKGERIVLQNSYGVIIDSLSYDNKNGWPEGDYLKNRSIELEKWDLDNALGSSWGISRELGTPGRKNHIMDFTESPDNPLPVFELSQNYPNPFNAMTTINYNLRKEGAVRLVIYNTAGKRVKEFKFNDQRAGKHKILWDGANLSSGVYFYKLAVRGFPTKLRKAVLIK